MEKRINLFRKQTTAASVTDKNIKQITYTEIGIGIFLFICFLGLFFVYNSQSNTLNALVEKKQQIEDEKAARTAEQLAIKDITTKNTQIKSLLKEDAQFSKYYTLLSDTLAANSLPKFTTISINSARITEFSFDIKSYEELNKILNFVESESFSSFFDILTVKTVSYEDQAETDTPFTLQFTGVLKNAQ